MKWTFLSLTYLFVFLLSLSANAQEAQFSLITPDSGPIDVKWEYSFLWSDDSELVLRIKVPSNIELVGHLPHPSSDAIVYELPVHDLFIKVNTVMLGTNRRILSSQGLTIQINDQKRGIIKKHANCPATLSSPLFSRTIITQNCRSENGGHLITERGYINGSKYENSYHLREIAQVGDSPKSKLIRVSRTTNGHLNLSENRGQEYRLGIIQSYLDQSHISSGDGLYTTLYLASTFDSESFEFTPSLKLGLFGLFTNSHHTPFKARRDEINLRLGYKPAASPKLKPSVVLKNFARTDQDHYFMGVAVGAGFQYQLSEILPIDLGATLFPHLSSRHFQRYQLKLSYTKSKFLFSLELGREIFKAYEQTNAKINEVSLNVSQRF